MTSKILLKDRIRAEVLKVLSGYCFRERHTRIPRIIILCPWITNVQLEIDKEVLKSDELFFGWDYGIRSINLPYALLLLKIELGAYIAIVTLPPTERNYNISYVSYVRNLLDFLDEIGCNILVNSSLHSKLILSNDLALIGSFNLSKAALYDKEEIGISIDDLSNLKILEKYANGVITSSTPYGYTIRLTRPFIIEAGEREFIDDRLVTNKVTRGWLYDQVAEQYFPNIPERNYMFLKDDSLTKSIYSSKIVKELASDLNTFYVKALLKYLRSPNEKDRKMSYLKERFNYQGNYEIGKILTFLKNKLARANVPKIPLTMFSFKKPSPYDKM